MAKSTSFVTVKLLTLALCAGTTGTAIAGRSTNPVDRISNPAARDFTNVQVGAPDMGTPFVRDGVIMEPQLFTTVKPGLAQAQVRSMLGEPLRQQGSDGLTWDYNFQLRLPQSSNFLVCQYKVRFDERQLVRDTVWRRRQCQHLTDGQQ
jgi:outer membrane protein assembly factor BamE (lipoprotein component of BamABCDE complex)